MSDWSSDVCSSDLACRGCCLLASSTARAAPEGMHGTPAGNVGLLGPRHSRDARRPEVALVSDTVQLCRAPRPDVRASNGKVFCRARRSADTGTAGVTTRRIAPGRQLGQSSKSSTAEESAQPNVSTSPLAYCKTRVLTCRRIDRCAVLRGAAWCCVSTPQIFYFSMRWRK